MFKLANKKRLVVFGFCFIFVLSILPLGLTQQITSYGTGADPPSGPSVFEDYSFNETYPPPDSSTPGTPPIFAYDFTTTTGWSDNGYGTITSDGDIATFNPTGYFNFDYEGINDPYEDGDDTFIGLSEIENGYDDTNIAGGQYPKMELQMIHAAYTGFEKTDFTDTGNINFMVDYAIYVSDADDYASDILYNRFAGADGSVFFIFAIFTNIPDGDFMYYNEALGSYVKLQDCLDDTWYLVKITIDQANKVAEVQISGNTYPNLPFRPSASGTGLSEIEFVGRTWGGDGFTAWLDSLRILGPSTSGAANDYACFPFFNINQPISVYVPFVEFNASGPDAALYLNSYGFEISSYGRTRRNVYAVAGPTNITTMAIYTGAPVYFDYIRFYGLEDYAVESGGVNDPGDVLYNSDDDLITAVEPNEFFNLTADVSDFDLAVYAYCKIEFSGAATISVTPLDTSGAALQTLNVTTSDDTIHFTAAGTVDKIKLTIYNSTTLYYITFSVMNININAITANYENTYLLDQQTIIISDVGAVWGDGAAISDYNIRVNLVENSTTLASNVTVYNIPTTSVQLYNTTYYVEVSWSNDTRFRYYVIGDAYSFWITGSNITASFVYDVSRLSDGNVYVQLIQTQQFRWLNGSAVSQQPHCYGYINSTDKGYKILGTDGWLGFERFSFSLTSIEASYSSYFSLTVKINDYEETVFNSSITPLDAIQSHLIFNFYSNFDGLGLADDLLKIYVDGARVYGMDTYTTGSTINLTITDYFNRPVYSKAAYSFTPADVVFIDVGLDFYPITFINPGYDTLIVELTANGVAKNITVPALGISQPYRAIAGTFSARVYNLDANGETEIFAELGDVTITSESYNIQLPAHKTRADVPAYPKGGGGISYSVFYSGLVWTGGIIIAAVLASGIYVKTTKGSTKPLEERIAPEVNIYTPSRYGGNIKKRSVSRNHPSRYGGNRRKNNLEEF